MKNQRIAPRVVHATFTLPMMSALLLLCGRANAQTSRLDVCAAIVHSGLHDEYHLKLDRDFSSSFNQVVCNSSHSSEVEAKSGNLGGWFEQFGVSLGLSSKTVKEAAQALCTNTTSTSNERAKVTFAASIVSPALTELVSACIQGTGGGFTTSLGAVTSTGADPAAPIPVGAEFALVFSWTKPSPNTPVPVIESLLEGSTAKCQGPRKGSRVLEAAQNVILCKRTSPDAGEVVLRTSGGHLRWSLAPSTPTIITNCPASAVLCRQGWTARWKEAVVPVSPGSPVHFIGFRPGAPTVRLAGELLVHIASQASPWVGGWVLGQHYNFDHNHHHQVCGDWDCHIPLAQGTVPVAPNGQLELGVRPEICTGDQGGDAGCSYSFRNVDICDAELTTCQ